MAVLNSLSLTALMVSMEAKQHRTWTQTLGAQELCESRSGRPGLPVPNSPHGFCGRQAALSLNWSALLIRCSHCMWNCRLWWQSYWLLWRSGSCIFCTNINLCWVCGDWSERGTAAPSIGIACRFLTKCSYEEERNSIKYMHACARIHTHARTHVGTHEQQQRKGSCLLFNVPVNKKASNNGQPKKEGTDRSVVKAWCTRWVSTTELLSSSMISTLPTCTNV